MAQLVIQGGIPLHGTIKLSGAKNASFKLMIASLLCPETVKLSRLSQIADVQLTQKILQSLGCQVHSLGPNGLTLNARQIRTTQVPAELGQASRASSLLIAPLLARQGTARVPIPGGDKIGRRPLDRHLAGLEALGAKIKFQNGLYQAQASQLTGCHYHFLKPTHTGTETLIMAAVLAKGKTRLENAALEPEIDDLIEFLNRLGAKIKRRPGRVIEIQGVSRLHSGSHQVMPDRNEAVSYAIAAYVTQGEVVVTNARPEHLQAFLAKLKQAGAKYKIHKQAIRFQFHKPLRAVNLTTRPHPGFMTDWQPLWSVLATQSQGTSRIIETVFTSRFQYVKALQMMGARIEFFQPQPKNPEQYYNFNLADDRPENFHGLKINGPSPLNGKKVVVTDIRAGATLALAGLAAQGKTILENVEHIDRGYENFAGRLQSLNAAIERID
jgi:UDP-N-acetylglucosamine 1-carboxyvinyltransferase